MSKYKPDMTHTNVTRDYTDIEFDVTEEGVYEINWDNVTTYHDLRKIVKAALTTVKMQRQDAIILKQDGLLK